MAHLVFQTAFPGDLFLSIPLLRRLREWDPQTPVTLACRPGLGAFFIKYGLVDAVIEIDKRSGEGRAKALRQMQTEDWDLIVVPHESLRTALWVSRLRARVGKVGFKKWWNSAVFTKRVVKPAGFPDALRQLSLLTPFDGRLAERFGDDDVEALRSPQVQTSPFDFRQPAIPAWAGMTVVPPKDAVKASGARTIFLAPGSVWATKRWTVQGYTELAKLLLQQGYTVELIGSAQEKTLCDIIAREAPGVENRAGQTALSDLVSILAKGVALIANDSGAMHAAAAADLPTVAIFGPTVLAQGFRPWQNRAIVVQRVLSCRPCGKHGAEVCPIGTHECMTEITAAQVYAALESILTKTAER